MLQALETKLSEEQIQTLKSQHKTCYEIEFVNPDTGNTIYVYFRKATTVEITRWKKEGTDDSPDRAITSSENLSRSCLIHPTKELATEFLSELPASHVTLCSEILRVSGLQKNSNVKKT